MPAIISKIPPAQPNPLQQGRRWALVAAVFAMLATTVPYLYALRLTGARPSLGWFSGYLFNATDNCVYLSWMRQAADGGFFQRNLFTTEAQQGHQFNLFFLFLGRLSSLVHLSPVVVYHAARFALGVALLRSIWWLLEMTLSYLRARKTAFLFVCFSSGLGWMPGLWERRFTGPTDIWQPESVTFLCLYLFPLFIVALLLMVGIVGWLLTAERTKSGRHALYAGLCGLLLGNIHTYDVITLMAVWSSYLVVLAIINRRWDWGSWGRGVLAALPTMVSTGYMFYLLKTETVFAQRAAVPTLSPPFAMVLLGFGITFALAIVAVWRGAKVRLHADSEEQSNNRKAWLFLVVWAVVNIAVSYTPVSFQRKMLMGAHIPVAILAGYGFYLLTGKMASLSWGIALAATTFLLSFTNLRFVFRDMNDMLQYGKQENDSVRSYMYRGEREALDWIATNAPKSAVVQPLPWIALSPDRKLGFFDNTVACFTPGLTGREVSAGHWGETPDYGAAMMRWTRYMLPNADDEYRRSLLRETGVNYIVFTQKHDEDSPNPELLSLFRQRDIPGLRYLPQASNDEADVYLVDQSH